MSIPNQNEKPLPESNPDEMYDRLIAEHLKAQNEIEYGLGDTLDIKMSIAIVIIIFLATQSSGFLSLHMPRHWHNLQVLSVVCLIVAGLLAVWELIPRTYRVGLSPTEYAGWLDRVKNFYKTQAVPNPETQSAEFIHRKAIEQMGTRFARNSALNKIKSQAVEWSFYFTMVAFVLNLLTLAGLTSGWWF